MQFVGHDKIWNGVCSWLDMTRDGMECAVG